MSDYQNSYAHPSTYHNEELNKLRAELAEAKADIKKWRDFGDYVSNRLANTESLLAKWVAWGNRLQGFITKGTLPTMPKESL